MVEQSGVEKSGVEKSGVEMFTQSLGLKLGVEKSGVEMSFNLQLDQLYSVLPTFYKIFKNLQLRTK